MKNPLITLDELVWKQFENVTQYAHKKWGWNKYDLATITDKAFTAVSVGASVYTGIRSAYYHVASFLQISGMALSLVWLWVSYNAYKNVKMDKKSEERELMQIVRTGAVLQPQFGVVRPILLSAGLCFIGAGAYDLLSGPQPASESFLGSPHEYSLLNGLTSTAIGGALLFQTFSNYFRSQLMTPPKAKKSIWKAAYESVASLGKYFKPAGVPKPVELPMGKYAAKDYFP